MEELYEDCDIWLTRTEAADWLKCSKGKVDHIIKEMKDRNWDGIFEDVNFLRINKEAMRDYIYKRRTFKYDDRRSKNSY